MNVYENFKRRLDINENNICKIDSFEIEVVINESITHTKWDQEYYETMKKFRIYITDPNRSTAELLFEFFREVGRICLHLNKYTDLHKADRYYDKNNIVSPISRIELVTDMTLDEFAAHQLDYIIKPQIVLPSATKLYMKSLFPLESELGIIALVKKKNILVSIRREYLLYVTKLNKTSPKVPKKLRINDLVSTSVNEEIKENRKILREVSMMEKEAENKKEEKKSAKSDIRIIAEKMKIPVLSDSFDTVIRVIIDTYGNSDTKHHKITSSFIVPYYLKLRRAFSTNDRNMYQFIITEILRAYVEDNKFEITEDTIKGLKEQYMNKDKHYSCLPKNNLKLMSYNERRNILMTIIKNIADKNNIKNYKINDNYELNNKMNEVVELYGNSPTDKRIETLILPFIVKSGA